MAETGFPVVMKNNYLDVSIEERIETESVPIYGITHFKEGPWTVQTIGSHAPSPGCMFYIEDYITSIAGNIAVNVTFGTTLYTPTGQIQEQLRLTTPGGVIPVKRFFKEKEALTFTYTTASGGDANSKAFGCAIGKGVSMDFFKTGTPIVVLGDSIVSGSGPSTGFNESIQILIDNLERHTAFAFRKVLKAKGGWNSTNARNFVNMGGVQYVKAKFGIFVIALGMNDAISATYSANLSAIIDKVKKAYPEWIVWVFGPTPAQGNYPNGTPGLPDGTSRESVLAVIRANAAGIVSALADPKIWYTNLGLAFSSVGDTNYFTNDDTTVGNRIHPNDSGNQGMADVLISALEADGAAKRNLIIDNLR